MATKQAPQPGQIDVNKLMSVLSEIFSEKYGVKVTMTARPKEATQAEEPAA